jgi:hypothetical protein
MLSMAPQSLTTKPLKRRHPRSCSRSSQWLAQAGVPLTEL